MKKPKTKKDLQKKAAKQKPPCGKKIAAQNRRRHNAKIQAAAMLSIMENPNVCS
ncbi:MAG: hypothetical protein K0U41_03575 [Gammaproteobacteria bacterium]|nr:hypothetical protein [Gammaproteobacteria bacterium]